MWLRVWVKLNISVVNERDEGDHSDYALYTWREMNKRARRVLKFQTYLVSFISEPVPINMLKGQESAETADKSSLF